jgi:hypothetical protein
MVSLLFVANGTDGGSAASTRASMTRQEAARIRLDPSRATMRA